MIMKCSLKDIFINILFIIIIIIIIISPSGGVEFPLFLPGGSVIGDSMNLQQLRASINRLQDLDSFPVSAENQLHKIVKKQMTNCDYHKRKNKRSIVAVPERLKSFDVMTKGDGNTKSLLGKLEIPKSRDSLSIPTYDMCLSKLAQLARNSGIRFESPSDRMGSDELSETLQKQGLPERGVGSPIQASPQFKEEKLLKVKKNQPNKGKNPDDLTQDLLDNIKAIMNSDVYVKANEKKIKDIPKTKDDEYDLDLQWPCMSVEDKIKKYLSKEQLPEIKFQVEETEDKIKENESKNKLPKGPEDKGQAKESKEKKEPGADDKKKIQGQKNDKQAEKGEKKNLDDGKTWENMSEKEMGKATKEQEEKRKEEEKLLQDNPNLKAKFRRIPDENDFRYYYECEARPNGCLKLRHKRCPQGQFFSFKFLKCLKADNKQENNKNGRSKSTILKRQTSFDSSSGNSERANEWVDASRDSTTVPSEFQSTTEPALRIYHLREKRKFQEQKAREMAENVEPDIGNRPEISNEAPKIIENPEVPYPNGITRKHRKHHAPRSYVIRIKKKEGKDRITENNENEIDNDEDDQDSEDDDEDEEVEDEEEEENDEEDISDDTTAKAEGSGQGLRDLFKAAKTAVTNRARFEDPTLAIAMKAENKMTENATKKETADSDNQNKKVLIDANIKVDSAIGSVLKSLMKSKRKDSISSLTGDEESLISDRGSQDQLDPELLRMYEHLMRSNPRVKRYFLANRCKKGK